MHKTKIGWRGRGESQGLCKFQKLQKNIQFWAQKLMQFDDDFLIDYQPPTHFNVQEVLCSTFSLDFSRFRNSNNLYHSCTMCTHTAFWYWTAYWNLKMGTWKGNAGMFVIMIWFEKSLVLCVYLNQIKRGE